LKKVTIKDILKGKTKLRTPIKIIIILLISYGFYLIFLSKEETTNKEEKLVEVKVEKKIQNPIEPKKENEKNLSKVEEEEKGNFFGRLPMKTPYLDKKIEEISKEIIEIKKEEPKEEDSKLKEKESFEVFTSKKEKLECFKEKTDIFKCVYDFPPLDEDNAMFEIVWEKVDSPNVDKRSKTITVSKGYESIYDYRLITGRIGTWQIKIYKNKKLIKTKLIDMK